MIEQKKKIEEDKNMAEEPKRVMAIRLEERISDVHKLTNTQLDMINQIILANKELNHKDVEITNLKSQKDILNNELKTKKQSMERFKKPNEVMK